MRTSTAVRTSEQAVGVRFAGTGGNGGPAMRDNGNNRELSERLIGYLEAILQLELSNRVARAKDIAGLMKVRRAAVTGALKMLAERGFINYSPYSHITLTSGGLDIAGKMIRKRMLVYEFFTDVLHLNHEAAEANADRIHHVIDQVGIDRLAGFLKFFKSCPAQRY